MLRREPRLSTEVWGNSVLELPLLAINGDGACLSGPQKTIYRISSFPSAFRLVDIEACDCMLADRKDCAPSLSSQMERTQEAAAVLCQ